MSITKQEAEIAASNAFVCDSESNRYVIGLVRYTDVWCKAVEWAQSEALVTPLPPGVKFTATAPPLHGLDVTGPYGSLGAVLNRAHAQAAHGKGAQRHQVNGEPFTEQVMQDMARRFGVGALLGQAFKKSEESQRLPHDRAVAELLGAINYLAGAVIALEARQKHANDNTPPKYGDIPVNG